VAHDVDLQLGGADLGGELLDPICLLYDEVFSQPPFFWRDDESQLHRERLLKLLGDPSFGVVVARSGDELAGFGYGFGLAPDTKRWQQVVPALPDEVTAEWPGRTFMLFDYAVRLSYRGRGVGRRLHDQLLGSRQEERATLTVQPAAVDTQAIYLHWGWRKVGEIEGGPAAAAPVFDAYLRDSLDDLRAGYSTT
jgi:ribosomal protein S18 acetylase RimI-like enzyme